MSQFSINNVMTWLVDWRNRQISSLPQGGIIKCGKVAGTVAVTHVGLTCLTTFAPIQGLSNLTSALTCKAFSMIWPSVSSGCVNLFECSAKDNFSAFFRGMELCARNLVQGKVPTNCSLATRIIGSGLCRPPQDDPFLRFQRDLGNTIADTIEKQVYPSLKEIYKKTLRDVLPVDQRFIELDERFIEQSGETLVQAAINSVQISRFYSREIREKLEVDHVEWNKRDDSKYWVVLYAPLRTPQLEQRPPSIGFVYQLTTDAKIVGYLIGTLHLLPTWMLAHKRMLDALDRSGEFVSELGEQVLSDDMEICRKFKKIVSMDVELTSEAKTRGIPIRALDTIAEQSTLAKDLLPSSGMVREKDDKPPKDFDLKEIEKMEDDILHSDLLSLCQNLWSQGSEEKLIDFRSHAGPAQAKSVFSERNRKWTEGENGLVTRLQRASSPICIAVGAGHLVGDDGLLAIFRHNGIQAEQIR